MVWQKTWTGITHLESPVTRQQNEQLLAKDCKEPSDHLANVLVFLWSFDLLHVQIKSNSLPPNSISGWDSLPAWFKCVSHQPVLAHFTVHHHSESGNMERLEIIFEFTEERLRWRGNILSNKEGWSYMNWKKCRWPKAEAKVKPRPLLMR